MTTSPKKESRGADVVMRTLEKAGATRVFTLSGNHIMSIFDAALETKLDLVHVRHEAAAVRAVHGDTLGLLVPGLRLAGGAAHDQRRVMTPSEASATGARWLILGRAVTGAPDPLAALRAVNETLRSVR